MRNRFEPTVFHKDVTVKGALNNKDGEVKPYKVYIATLTQTGTNAPIATVLENTLGEVPTWSYVSAGTYRLNTIGDVFVDGKTVLFSTVERNNRGGENPLLQQITLSSSIIITRLTIHNWQFDDNGDGIVVQGNEIGQDQIVIIEIRVYY